MDGGAWWAAVHGVWRVRHNWVNSLSLSTFMHWRRDWKPFSNGTLKCSCLENPRDGRAWWAAVYGVAQSWTLLKWLSSSSIWINIYFFLSCQKVAVRKDWSFIITRNFINFTGVEIEYECFLCAYDLIYPKYELKSFKMHIYILMMCISMK